MARVALILLRPAPEAAVVLPINLNSSFMITILEGD